MFERLGDVLSKWWFIVLGIWIAALVGLRIAAPPFNDLAKGGQFVFLPGDMPSRQGEALLNRAFPGRQTSCSMVIVVYREAADGITDDDRSFIDEKLKPACEDLRDRLNDGTAKSTDRGVSESATNDTKLITDIRTFSSPGIGNLLVSDDKMASLVTIDMTTDFLDSRNWQPVHRVSTLLTDFENGSEIPKGLRLALSGSATLGRDITSAEAESARNTSTLTVAMVIVLLVIIYRAPLLALVPLLTLFIAVDVALRSLTMFALAGYVPIFKGLKEYATVLSYGPGIDYCMFLIARYKENIVECVAPKQALSRAIGQVGSAIAASGATVICGIGMLTFAQFGKFHEAGIGISVTLAITLCATLTLTPSMLFMTGHWAFWPRRGAFRDEQSENVVSNGKAAVQQNLFQPIWTFVGGTIERHPLLLLLLTLGGMLPFVVFGIAIYGNVNYGLVESLPKSATSAVGTRILEKHFPAGITGPVQILLQDSGINFREDDGIAMINDLVEKIMKRQKELNVVDIRSVSAPLGMSSKARDAISDDSSVTSLIEIKAARNRSVEHYVTEATEFDGHVTELDVILDANPFSIDAVNALPALTKAIHDNLPSDQSTKTEVSIVGPTASVKDVISVSHSDQQQIYILVVASVFVILVVLLRTFTISLYLIVTVLLSYLCTLGISWLSFYAIDPSGFIGLDWTVPLFLFVVLIAVGEDYNIFLVSRIREEQERRGKKQGITLALSQTGGIITSCGFIMAGTFASLCAGSLVRMQQLGFALAVGVLLDTFVIRPILVPAFLMVLNDERFGNVGRFLK